MDASEFVVVGIAFVLIWFAGIIWLFRWYRTEPPPKREQTIPEKIGAGVGAVLVLAFSHYYLGIGGALVWAGTGATGAVLGAVVVRVVSDFMRKKTS